MDNHVVRVILQDGRKFEQLAVRRGLIVQVRGFQENPFSTADMSKIKVDHKK